jgi:hypothetical protein
MEFGEERTLTNLYAVCDKNIPIGVSMGIRKPDIQILDTFENRTNFSLVIE